MLDLYGEAVAIRHARKHLGWYLQRFAPDLLGDEKAAIMTSRDPREVAARLYDALAASVVDSREAA
jgi:tRNA-dihydrouridine synthase B